MENVNKPENNEIAIFERMIQRILSCDRCVKKFGEQDPKRTATQHRKKAKASGWRYVKGKDYCPDCNLAISKRISSSAIEKYLKL